MNFHLIPMFPLVVDDRVIKKTKHYKKRKIGYDKDFKQLYRFTRRNVDFLAEHFMPTNLEKRGGALSNVQKMRCFLRYIGDPGFQVCVGEDLGVHQATVSNANWYVCQNIVQKAAEWIKFPNNPEEMEEEKKLWQKEFTFPCAIGAVDCIHFAIKKPTHNGDEYINRNNTTSVNIQATCNAKEIITSINCKWPGSVDDALIWQNSNIQNALNKNTVGAILLGDIEYPLTPWVMTPFRNPQKSREIHYNKVHKIEHCVIDRMFVQLKQRFPILQSKIRIATERVPSMIVACCVLYNVAKFLNDPDFELPAETIENNVEPGELSIDERNNSSFERGQKRRAVIANYLHAKERFFFDDDSVEGEGTTTSI